jgi:hypothetical protein
VESPEGQRSLGRTGYRWWDSIKMKLQKIGVDSFDLAQDKDKWRAVCKLGHGNSSFIKCGEILDELMKH